MKALIINTKIEASIWFLIKINEYFSKRLKKPNKIIDNIGFNINF